MDDILAGLGGYANLTPGGIVLLVILLIFTGRLVPSRYYNEALSERDRWRLAAETEERKGAEYLQQNGLLIEALKTTQHVIESIPAKGGEE